VPALSHAQAAGRQEIEIIRNAVAIAVQVQVLGNAIAITVDQVHAGGQYSIAAALGPFVGGVLVQYADWRWIFLINAPIAALTVAAAWKFVPETKTTSVGRFDVPGAVLVTGGLSSLVYAITQAGTHGWTSGRTIGFFVASAVMLVACLLACIGPARRALRINPADALREG